MTTFATLQKPDNPTKRHLYPFWGKQPLSRLSDIHRLHLPSYPSSLHQIRPQHHEIVFCLTHNSNPSYAHIPKRDFLQQDRMNEEKFVIYQGTRMVEGWPERIRKAQKQRTYNIAGKEHA